MIKICDTCGDEVETGTTDDFSEHNLKSYVKHVYLSHSRKDGDRIIQEFIQEYIERYEIPKSYKYGLPGIGLAVSPYITIFADEDGVIWARGMVDGEESDRFSTVGIEPTVQDAFVVLAVTQVLMKIRR